MNIVITGASRGIGLASAQILSADPQHNILLLSRNTKKLKQISAEAVHQNVDFLSFDLMNQDRKMLLEKLEKWPSVDVLINNAGKLLSTPFEDLTMENWKTVFGVNVFGVVELIQVCLPFLEKSGNAHVLNISSMGGFQGASKFPGLSAYSTSKAAVANLTECLAEEFKEKNIAVNCLALGAVQTEMLEEAFPGYQAPLSSQQMGEFIAYFSTKGHSVFNGKILPVALSTP